MEIIYRVSWSDLFTFLTEHKALNAYITNSIMNSGIGHELRTIEKTLRGTPELWISSVFVWGDTKEGQNFWKELNDKWCQKLHEVKRISNGLRLLPANDSDTFFETVVGQVREKFTGKQYKITDFSWNRTCLPQWESEVWTSSCFTGISPEGLSEEDRVGLIVEEPVVKRISDEDDSHWDWVQEMVKVYVPKLRELHWFVFKASCVQE